MAANCGTCNGCMMRVYISTSFCVDSTFAMLLPNHYPSFSLILFNIVIHLYVSLSICLFLPAFSVYMGSVSTTDEHNLMYIVTGAGNTCCTNADRFDEVPSEYLDWYVSRENKPKANPRLIGGFSSVIATKEGIKVKFYDQEGNELYSTKTVPPRDKIADAGQK